MSDPLRAAILGDGETRVDSFEAAARVRAMLTSDEAVERAAIAIGDKTHARLPHAHNVIVARAAILAVLGDPT